MTRDQYIDLLTPVINEVLDLLIDSEEKHGEGLNCTNFDGVKCAKHAIAGYSREVNPDGFSHYTASAARAMKARLWEMTNGN
jgi:hypothetical protein